MKLARCAMACALLLVMIETAHADDLAFYSTDGPMWIHLGASGRVSGQYQQDSGAYRTGRLTGSIRPDGTIEGSWLQAESDHPCTHPREGTMSWGNFMITNAWGPNPYGVWGYCSEAPNRSWNLQRR